MDDLIKELVADFKKQEKKVEEATEKIDKEAKIVAKVNKNGGVEILGVSGSQSALLSTICTILRQMEKHSEDSAEHMAMIILTALETEKKMHERKSNIRFI